MYVVMWGVQWVLVDDCVNFEQGGLCGLLWMIGVEYFYLCVIQIDVDEQIGVEQLVC